MEKDNKRLRANSDIILRDAASEAVLIPVGDAGILENNFIVMNENCRDLWQLFQTPRTVEEVLAEIRRVYSDSESDMEQDIREFVEKFSQYGLLMEE